MDHEGYLKITDFGLSKQGLQQEQNDKTYSFCGTPEYVAPEIVTGVGHDTAADWWSLGALIYEMLCGHPPFYSQNQNKMLQDRVSKRVQMYDFFSAEAWNLLNGLLEREPAKRIGDVKKIKRHPFFKKIDWDQLMLKKLKPPFKPTVSSPEDTRNIDHMFL